MKTILLSMQPFWAEKIMSGEKIYEYRNKFADEEVKAYLYVSKPNQEISGILKLGKRELLTDWENEYKNDETILRRIQEYRSRKNKYAMPVLSFQRTTGLRIEDIRDRFPEFLIPQSYYYLDDLPLLDFIKSRLEPVTPEQVNYFDNVQNEDICKKYR